MGTNSEVGHLLGICRKAGLLTLGVREVSNSILDNTCFGVIIARDASKRSKSKVIDLCREYEIPAVEWSEQKNLGVCVGNPPLSVVGVKDSKMAAKVIQLALNVSRQSGFNTEYRGGH